METQHADGHAARTAAYGLGWLSIALGVGELFRPADVQYASATPAPKSLVRAFGLREIASGVCILAARDPVPMVWTRVAGDLLDLAALAPGLSRGESNTARATGALATVLAITAIDIAVAAQARATA